MSVLSSIFKKRSTSSTKFLLSFYCRISLFRSCLLSQLVSLAAPAHKFNFCCYAFRPGLFVTTPRACAMKSKLDRPHLLVEYASSNLLGYIDAYSTLRCGLSYILILTLGKLLRQLYTCPLNLYNSLRAFCSHI